MALPPAIVVPAAGAVPALVARESPSVLHVHGLGLDLVDPSGRPRAALVRDVSFDLARGRCLGLVGESGSGKSLTALAVIGLLPEAVRAVSGQIELAGQPRAAGAEDPDRATTDLLTVPERRLIAVRGRRIGMVFQEPMAALNPVRSIGGQLIEAIRRHHAVDRATGRARALDLLDEVALPGARRRLGEAPHRFSGGERQRVLIALALAGRPDVLLADEPTSALDVTVQTQILELLAELMRQRGLAVLLVSHDFGVVARLADEVAVMYAGRLVERGPASRVLAQPGHPYTAGLLSCLPRLGGPRRARLPAMPGSVPAPGSWPAGCSFHPRCPRVVDACRRALPPALPVPGGSLHGSGEADDQRPADHWARCVWVDPSGPGGPRPGGPHPGQGATVGEAPLPGAPFDDRGGLG